MSRFDASHDKASPPWLTLLWIGKDRTTKTFLRFFRMLGTRRSGELECVCSDMWKPYLKVIAKKASLSHNLGDLPEPEFIHRFW